ncbi:g10466 [Coccomyxa viridis]|uniref:G10466 protein n=1 Tax=Coccomyxa viridis TaxID=1274662 RepID=A0ABP1G5U3_9CHLO
MNYLGQKGIRGADLTSSLDSGDDESDELTLQVDQTKASGTSAGQRPDPLAGAVPGKQPKGIGGRIKQFFLGDKMDAEKLKALGLGAVSSYGAISNVTYGGGLAVAWIAFVRQFNKSPLEAGQWKAFVAFYAGFWTLQNFVRPLRFSLAIALAPVFERFLNAISSATGLSKSKAFGVYLFILGTVTSTLVFGSIFVFAGPLAYAR